ncbi:unnamed protein product [Blumeria hordei]|uniref:Calcofluor white hypersensitive protein n=2 Tax=Blumeria hordei TaxID=2867405 RepID=A0A383UVD8_BLUHO|nr:hypothetical protein BGHDH14_bgh01545 [Blumeria hordei DH14]SZF03242.1 unnamed protein product [Blumeria hordei]
MAQQKKNFGLYLGVATASGIGYYLYQSGGDSKIAKKQLKDDLSHASDRTKSKLPDQNSDPRKLGEKWATKAGEEVDHVIDKGRAELARAEDKVSGYEKETGKKIDEADQRIEENAAATKSGLAGWLGGK